MSRVNDDMPSTAQHNDVGMESTNPAAGALATSDGGAVRITPADGALGGWMGFSFTVAFIGDPGFIAIRAVSLRGPACAPAPGGGDGRGAFAGTGPDGIGFADAGGSGFAAPASGGPPDFSPGGSGGGFEAVPGGRIGAGGRAIGGAGGRLAGAPPPGSIGLGATDGGGGRTAPV